MHVTLLQDDGVALGQPPCVYGLNNASVPSSESRECQKHHLKHRNHPAWSADCANTVSLTGEPGSQLSSLQLIPAKIFQLTEWVYKVLASPQPATNDKLVLVYHRCLDWYESFFAMLKTDGNDSPFVLFIQ